MKAKTEILTQSEILGENSNFMVAIPMIRLSLQWNKQTYFLEIHRDYRWLHPSDTVNTKL